LPETANPTLGPAGSHLWETTTATYTMEPHEERLLLEACRTLDNLDDLAQVIEAEGVLLGDKVHPAVTESRHQRVLFSRLITALRVPLTATGTRPQLRSVRGTYQPRS
jgi:hypothetical protein